MTDHSTLRHGTRPVIGWSAEVTCPDGSATTIGDVLHALHAVFPNLRFATTDIEDQDATQGLWLVPIPRELGADITRLGRDFGWSEIIEDPEGGEYQFGVFVAAP